MKLSISEEKIKTLPIYENSKCVYIFKDGLREVWILEGKFPATFERLVIPTMNGLILWREASGWEESMSDTMQGMMEEVRYVKKKNLK